MYFTKVELHNFGIYKGTHEMCLTDQIGNRNITLVGGLNGRGKTTFHDSILIALYGKQALKYIVHTTSFYLTISISTPLTKRHMSQFLCALTMVLCCASNAPGQQEAKK